MQLTKGAIGNLINRYKAVLKKCHLMNTFGSLAVAGMLVMGGAGMAVAADDVALGAGGSYDKTDEVNHLMGGGLYKDNKLTAVTPVTTDITLSVEGGSISEIIGGSYISGTNADYKKATHGTITTTISGETTSAEFVVGGSKLANNAGATLETGTTAVTINGGIFGTEGKTNAYELVMGGNYIKTGTGASGTATTDGSSVTVNGGTFHASVVGGSVAHNYSGAGITNVFDNGNTSVTITGGTFNSSESSLTDGQGGINLKAAVIGGGLAYGANTSSVLGSDAQDVTSRVSISGDAQVNGKVVAGSVVANGGYAAIVHGDTSLSMTGGTVNDDLVGGGMANGEGASASVTSTNVSITGGIIDGKVVAGGLAINGGTTTVEGNTLLTMTDGEVSGDLIGGNLLEKNGKDGGFIASTTVSVEGGTVAGEIYGGSYVRNTAGTSEVANTTVNINGGTIGAKVPQGWAQYVVGGGKAMSNATETESNVLETAAVNISDGDITRGAVVGGGFARAQGASGSATANVEDSVVNLTGGTLVGIVGGGLAENLGTASSSATATASVTTASLTIDGNATVNGIIYKGNDAGNTSPSAAVIGGGLAYSKNGSKATASVGTANTIINGGTINGDVYAGGMADGANAQANVDNASLTIKGGTINGNVYAGGYALNKGTADVTTAIITLDGTGAKVTGDFEGNKTSTLTFNNYDDKFNNAAYGFGTLNVAEGSNVRMDAVVSGKQGTASEDPKTGFFGARPDAAGSSNPITITGGGTITAKQFHVSTNADVTIAHGNVVADDVQVQSATLKVGGESTSASLTVNEKLTIDTTYEGNQNIDVENLGTLTLGKNIVLDENGKLKTEYLDTVPTHVKAGGTLKVNGLEDGKPLTSEELASLQGLLNSNIPDIPPGEGLLDLGGADLGEAVKPNADGTVSYDNVAGITTNSLKDTTVTVTDEKNAAGISGGFQAVKLTENDTELNAKGTLVLAGSQNGDNLVIDKDGNVADLRVGGPSGAQGTSAVTLGLADANNSGRVGTVTLNAGTDNKATLNVIGAGAAEFTVGDIRANYSTNTINVAGATLNTGNITTESGTKALDKLNITSGSVNASGDVKITGVVLANGVLAAHEVGGAAGAPNGGNITLGNLSGQGVVDAAKKLELTSAYNGADTDALGLQADTLTTGAFDSTKGDVAISAATWTSGATTLKGDAVELTKAGTFTGAFAMDGGTLVAQSGDDANLATLTFNDDATFTNGAVAVADSIVMADTTGTTGSGGTLTVGTGDDTVGGTTLSAKHIDLNGGMLLVDPAWGLASSNVAVETLTSGDVGVGQNSYLALGTADTSWLPGVVTGYTKGVGLSKDGVTAALGVYKGLTIGTGKALLVDGSKMDTATGPALTNAVNAAADNSATFADNSLLVINGADDAIAAGGAAISFEATGTLKVDAGAKLLVTDAVAGQAYTIVGNVNNPGVDLAGWKNNGMTSTTDMISLGDAKFDGTDKVTTSAVRNDAHTVFPNLSDGMANAVNDLYTGHAGAAGQPNWDYADVNSDQMGVRFLSRATDNRFLGADKDAAAATIESAARIAFAGAVPQMTKMASDAGTNAVVNRLGFANPADGAQAMDAEGKIVDRNTTGFALWIAPLWQSQHGWGMEADNLDYGFNGNLGGVSLGADYTFENAIRAGITFNIGGGYAESSGGDLNSTENRMSFWGLGAYAGWNYENFGLMADVSYTSTWNDLKQDMDSRMGMGDLEADVQASAISAGLRAEYKLETSVLDVIPHIGVRYMSLNTWGFDAESNGGTVLEGDGFHQDIWTFPVGVTFTKDFTLDSGWSFKPSVDFSVIPAAGDIKAKQDVAFTGLPGSYEVETQMMDYLTWQGGVGLEMGNDTMSFGVNYTLQAGQHTTGHGVFGSFRYEF